MKRQFLIDTDTASDDAVALIMVMRSREVEVLAITTVTVVDRLNVAANERNRGVWAAALAAGHKAKIVWTIDNGRWKQALYAALRDKP